MYGFPKWISGDRRVPDIAGIGEIKRALKRGKIGSF
jgi:hypothetical protein